MNVTQILSNCRFILFAGLKILCLALPLSGCLKVTGPAKDSFDLEEEEPSFNVFEKALNKNGTKLDVENESEHVLRKQESTALSAQERADFELWKKARSQGSREYEQFKEYQEFKEYQRWLELRDATKPNLDSDW